MDAECGCGRKGSGSTDDLRVDGWIETPAKEWLCPACVETLRTGVASPTVPPSSGEPGLRDD
jgi:hypothetical protein